MGRDASGTSYVKKSTKWMTNSKVLAELLNGVCSNRVPGGLWHRHVHLVNGRATMARVYPPELVKAVLKGIRAQMKEDGEFRDVNASDAGPSPEIDEHLEDFVEDFTPSNEQRTEGQDEKIFYDDITGVQLDTQGVLEARRQELAWIHKAEVYTKRSLEECYERTGKAPITLKWIDRNKGDTVKPNYRSRLVVREIKKQHGSLPGHMLFSNMPPLEAAKLLCSMLATKRKSKRGKPLKLALFDISRAHFYGKAQREIYVTLPEGDDEEGKCALLLKTMYGTQDASHVWQLDYTALLLDEKFEQGKVWTSVFVHKEQGIKLLVHGDDFFVLADQEGQDYMRKVRAKKYDFT